MIKIKQYDLVLNGYEKVRLVVLALILMVPGFVYAADVPREEGQPAGEVSLVLGQSYVRRANSGESIRLTTGAVIFVGDRIKTLGGGHVHVHFIDDALVSVRPNSQLTIDFYEYDPENPAASIIRFDLTEGRVRSISGKGAKAARDKFRLNTPIAAIGVRGTDFVVSTDQRLVRAIVNEGAIVVAPFSEVCASDGVARCDVNAVELRGNSKHIVEFSTLLRQPRLIPIDGKFIPELMEGDATAAEPSDGEVGSESTSNNQDAASGDKPAEAGSIAEGQSGEGLDEVIEDMSDISSDSDLLKNDPNTPLFTSDSSAVEAPKPDNYMPELAVSTEVLSQRQLVWGRWSNAVLATDRVIANRSNITDGRSVTVGNSEFVLYRSNSELETIKPGLGAVEFNLQDAQATLTRPDSIDTMQVKGGWLNINFSRGTFETGVNLKHYLTSDMELSVTGNVNELGFFNSRAEDGVLTGATSLDGNEASYYFSQQNEFGTINGITYWISK